MLSAVTGNFQNYQHPIHFHLGQHSFANYELASASENICFFCRYGFLKIRLETLNSKS